MMGLDDSILTIDEFEAIRLRDYEGLDQNEAAKKMGISQPTFQRLYESARGKIADVLVNGKALKIEGGPFRFMGRGKGCSSFGPGFGSGRGFRGRGHGNMR